MQFGEVLRKTRKDAGFTQEDIGEILIRDRSSISKLETDSLTLYISDAIKWMDATKRHDIIFALISGLDVDRIMNHLFDVEYLSKVKNSELFKNLNEELTIEDIESYVLNKSENAVEWKKYLSELIGDPPSRKD